MTDPEPRFAIQPTRLVSTATATGSTPVSIRRTVSLLSAFTIVTVSSRLFATQRSGPSPATYTTAVGPLPTLIRLAPRVVPRRTRSSQWLPQSVSHAYPPPTATPAPIEPIPDAAPGAAIECAPPRASSHVPPPATLPTTTFPSGRGEARRVRTAAIRVVLPDNGFSATTASPRKPPGGRPARPPPGHEDGQQRGACDHACRRHGRQPATANRAGQRRRRNDVRPVLDPHDADVLGQTADRDGPRRPVPDTSTFRARCAVESVARISPRRPGHTTGRRG